MNLRRRSNTPEFIWLAVIKDQTDRLITVAFRTDEGAWEYITKMKPKYGQVVKIPLYGNMYDYEVRTHNAVLGDEKEG